MVGRDSTWETYRPVTGKTFLIYDFRLGERDLAVPWSTLSHLQTSVLYNVPFLFHLSRFLPPSIYSSSFLCRISITGQSSFFFTFIHIASTRVEDPRNHTNIASRRHLLHVWFTTKPCRPGECFSWVVNSTDRRPHFCCTETRKYFTIFCFRIHFFLPSE